MQSSEEVTQRGWSGSVMIARTFLPAKKGLSRRRKKKKIMHREIREGFTHFYGMKCLAFILLPGHESSNPYCYKTY